MTFWQHVPFENEAAIGRWAWEQGINYKVIRTWEGEALEADDLLVVLGGSMSAYDDLDFIRNEIDFLRRHIMAGGKVFGICLGAQLIAAALGAKVYPSGSREAGWREVTIAAHPLTRNMEGQQTVFHWHGDTFDTPEGMMRIASNDAFPNQAFASMDGRVIATQFHFETTPESIAAILEADGDYLHHDSPYVANVEAIRRGERFVTGANQILFMLLDAWRKV